MSYQDEKPTRAVAEGAMSRRGGKEPHLALLQECTMDMIKQDYV